MSIAEHIAPAGESITDETGLHRGPMTVLAAPAPRQTARRAREVCDRVFAGVTLAVLSPLLLLIAAAVRLTSPGPALFRQTRVGLNGRRFTLLKFRTMHAHAELELATIIDLNESDGVLFKVRRDPRVTAIGRWLRRFSLDELPQLWNVVRGEMALVGPRPPLPREVDKYDAHVVRRLSVKPGMTGLWQVSGRSELSWAESIRLDLQYVDAWRPSLDVQILWRTVGAVLSGRGAW